jgi:hypothetical protein
MNLLKLISNIFDPAAKLIDDVHTSTDEKLAAKAQLMLIQAEAVSKALEYEKQIAGMQRDIIVAETKTDSWLTRTWRPIVMLSLAGSALAYWFGLTPTDPVTGLSTIPLEIVNRMFSLVQLGVGGYIAGRSVEKVAPKIVDAFKQKDKT